MYQASGLTLLVLLMVAGCGSGGYSSPTPSYPVTGASINGRVLSGQQPVAGAHVYLLAANATGYGSSSISLLDADSTGYADLVGTYVLSGVDGSFVIPGYYTCLSSQQLYLYARGGNSGLGENSAATEMAVLGNCPAKSSQQDSVQINEVTTVAAAYAIGGFATDALHVSTSGTPLALTGIANAFANAFKLVSPSTGMALATIPAGSATVPQSTINTLANILNSCVHSLGSSSAQCITLFSSVQAGTTSPTDTATAMLAIVHHPASNVPTLFAVQTSTSPFNPSLSAVPNDYTVGVEYTGGGMVGVTALRVDSQGDVWLLGEGSGYNNYVGSIAEISPSGSYLSGPNGYNASLYAPGAMAIDTYDDVWIANAAASLIYNTSMIELSNSGVVLSGNNGFSNGSLYLVASISFDPSGNLWMTDSQTNALTEMTPSGQFLSGPAGFTGGGLDFPVALAFEPSGSMWIANDESVAVSQFSDSGQPLTNGSGLTAPGFYGGADVAIDAQGSVWYTRQGSYPGVAKVSQSGSILSAPGGYTGGGISTYQGGFHIAIDGDGNAWIPLWYGTGIVELSNSGNALSGSIGYQSGIASFPLCVAIDGSGDAWISSSQKAPMPIGYTDRITELIGIAAPTVTPLAAAVKNNALGVRP